MIAGIAVGTSEAVMLLHAKGPIEAAAFAGFAVLGSLLPDVDLPNTKMGKRLGLLSDMLNKRFGHRGFIHTPLCGALLTLGLYAAAQKLGLKNFAWFGAAGLMTGYLLHLIQDMFTRGGVPLLFPLSRGKIALTKFRSNSRVHAFITIALIVLWFYTLVPFSNWLMGTDLFAEGMLFLQRMFA